MTTIHRLLDEAFAGIDPTPEVVELKEEVRANLEARAAELEAAGATPADAAARAIAELGDVRELVEGLSGPRRAAGPSRMRVRPRPAFVVRTVVLVAVAAIAFGVLAAEPFGLWAPGLGWLAVSAAALAAAIGLVTADALRQETTTNHPLPRARAAGFGAAGGAALAALGTAWLVVRGLDPAWLVGAAVLGVGSVAAFAYLGATKTNRHKAWVLRERGEYPDPGDRFSVDPAAAARFGIYNLVIWVAATTVFIVLTVTVGWAWSWTALVAGFVVMLVVLARMLFPPAR